MNDEPAHVYELVAETLASLGHRTLFGLLGSGNFQLADHFVRNCGGRHVWVRHEAAGVSAADAYAQATHGLGVATAHQGPGFTNTLTALTQAVKERTPLLLVVGETARGRHVSQTIDVGGTARALGAGVERVRGGATVVADVARAAARAQRERHPGRAAAADRPPGGVGRAGASPSRLARSTRRARGPRPPTSRPPPTWSSAASAR